MKIYSIEGNIGAGKSTIIEILKKSLNENNKIIYLPEPIDEWNSITDSSGVNILTKFYSDQKKYSFSFQMMAFITRVKQLHELVREYSSQDVIIITERSMYTDREVFAKMLFDKGSIEDIEYSIYLKWFDYFIKDLTIDGIIYIKVTPQNCLSRISKRNRSGESLGLEYLFNLEKYHNDWLSGITGVLILDNNGDYVDIPKIKEYLKI